MPHALEGVARVTPDDVARGCTLILTSSNRTSE
jgi:hypothetical protein